MIELLRTNDPALLSWVVALLKAEGIDAVVLDSHTSALEGSISAIPRRVMVAATDAPRADALVREAGLVPGSTAAR
ncbi:MAG: DUF2007 domain-containing protein [Alphaproteobacteria bacterium]|nr:DUF2007 domain-containing protein [Alphaproteobacteria bacterium]